MATSGSVDFTSTRDEIIKDALTLCRAIDPDETVDPNKNSQAARFFNRMIKAMMADGLHLWTKANATLFLDKGTQLYTFPTAYATDSTDFDDTTTSAAAASGASSFSVTSAGTIAAGDYLSIELDSGSRQWTTVGAISGTTITLPTGTTLSGAVASGNEVIAFTTKINRPLKIIHVRRIVSSNETPVEPDSVTDYMNIPNKSSSGLVNEYYYSPLTTTGNFYVWPTGNTATDRLAFTYQRPIEDVDVASDNPDFPVEHHEMLVSNLAYRLAPTYDVPNADYQKLREQAMMFYEMVRGFDNDFQSVYIRPR